jgi:hypothetical protein
VIIPLSLLILANITLIIRIIYQKISRNQAVHWGRHRKMAFQLWSISSLYLILWIPTATVVFIQLVGVPSFLSDQFPILIFISNSIPVLLPFVCLGVFPEILKSVRNLFGKQRRNQVGTVTISLQTRFQAKQ